VVGALVGALVGAAGEGPAVPARDACAAGPGRLATMGQPVAC